MCKFPDFSQHNPVTYTEHRDEVLPPLHEVIAEHERMKVEIRAAKMAAESSFVRTLDEWYWREKGNC